MERDPAKTCCICGRVLPNAYAVAGTCVSGDGCTEAFCAFHWHVGNRLCRRHGWREPGGAGEGGGGAGETPSSGDVVLAPVEAPVPADASGEPAKRGVHAALGALAKFGSGVAGLVKKLAGIQSPGEMAASCEAALAANRERREPLMARCGALFREISAKKKTWQTAPAARKSLLEMELRTLLAEYRGLERQLAALFENERTLVSVLARLQEVAAYGMRQVSEKQVDGLADKLADAAGEADALVDAMGDLEKAGKRRERAADDETLEEALAGFDAESAGPVFGAAAEPEVSPPQPASEDCGAEGPQAETGDSGAAPADSETEDESR